MSRQFDDDQVAVLQQIIHEHQKGLEAGTGEYFGPRQKPLTYSELAAVRRMLVLRTASEAAERATKYANDYASGLLDTFLPPLRYKTSKMLTDAANLIGDVAQTLGTRPILMGRDWGLLVAQLRDRATTLKELDQ